MKVLHISHSDIYGGAAIAGFRLHQGLLGQGADSKMMVERVDLGGERITSIPKKAYWEARIAKPAQAMGLSYLPLISSFAIAQHPFYQAAEVLQLHNLHSGFFNYLALPKLTQHKPAVWTLHDMWALTGHCSYSYECDRWKSGCGQCPHPETYPAIKVDNTHLEWKLKSWVYGQSNLAIVAPSSWLVKQAQQSILNRFAIHHIPHGIDTSLYQPLDPQKCRHLLGIPTDKRHVLLFVAFSLKEARKGADLLIQALQGLRGARADNRYRYTQLGLYQR
jgi:glycosyltransferase involved in cell wall biosynthesis